MQITSRFTIAVHIICALEYFGNSETVTSNFLAGSVGANPVIVRNVMGNLKEAGIIRNGPDKANMLFPLTYIRKHLVDWEKIVAVFKKFIYLLHCCHYFRKSYPRNRTRSFFFLYRELPVLP